MKEVTAKLSISLDVVCPHCDEGMDLICHDNGLNDEGEMIKQACPDKGVWNETHAAFEQEVTCAYCGSVFVVKGIDW